MFETVLENKEWLFSGLAIAVVAGLWRLFGSKREGPTQKQHGGAGSTNVQAGRDANIGLGSESDESDNG